MLLRCVEKTGRCTRRSRLGVRGGRQTASKQNQQRMCSNEAAGERRIFGDEEFVRNHESQVRTHRDFYWPVLYIVGSAFGAWFVGNMYMKLTTRDKQGKAFLDELIFHKRDKILGDKPQGHNTNPTLLIDVYDLLVCLTYRDGCKFQQAVLRPGAEVFLDRLKDKYEIVIYSLSELGPMQELFGRLDPNREIFTNLITRELIKRIDCGVWPYGVVPSFLAPRYKKNLNDIGRRLERVVHVECEPDNIYDDKAQDDNRIIIPKYDGSDTDRELLHLLPFLEYLSDKTKAPFDVRRAIHFYQGKAEEYGVENIGVAYILYQEEKNTKAPKVEKTGWNLF
eukprot:TRINITY_DN1538_c2_g2_i2.p1 TRINITY_DN1538_c2_g2~~TRINITY_DN1538_c2_g2_i2.p1  ORF type:complete len:352 (+),score=69.74 TRINITY_DN1538_c2_g2_i2:46-1056(+)